MKPFLVAAAVLPVLFFAHHARALPLESADLLSTSSQTRLGSNASQTFGSFVPNGTLRTKMDFWLRIYTQYYTYQGVIHDSNYIDHVYEVIDFGSDGYSSRKVRELKVKWKKLLLSVHIKQNHPEAMNEEELRVFRLFADIDEPNKFQAAAHRKRLRFQLGQKDRFLEGLKISGRYLPAMEEIFRREGLPIELTRLPFVESSFNVRARSKVGASGIWQFMRSTGRLFLRINDAVDERNDPLRATEAAARLLKINFDSLRTWPLAITAYNHGRQGMMRAVRNVGSDELEDLISEYRSRRFGFASSNFFAELLAAIEAEKNAEQYFGKVERERPMSIFEAELPDGIALKELVRFLRLDANTLRELNPALSEVVFRGQRAVPAGYKLRLPFDGKGDQASAAKVFLAGFEQIPAIFKHKGQRRGKYGTGEKTGKTRYR